MSDTHYGGGIGCAGQMLLGLLLIYVLYHMDPIINFLDRLLAP